MAIRIGDPSGRTTFGVCHVSVWFAIGLVSFWVGVAISPAHAQTVTSTVTYTYGDEITGHTNSIGRLALVEEKEGSTTVVRSTSFDYDVRGNITKTVKVIESATYTTQQTYDSLNRVETVTYPDGEVVTNAFDPAGNLDTVSGLKGGVTTNYVTDTQYDAFGKRTQMTFGNGTQTTYTYDPNAFRLQQLATTGPGGPLQTLSYTYDAVGNVLAITDGVNAAYNESFGYDDLHRLTSATGPYGALTYAYDQIGNMTCNSQLGPCTASSANYGYPPSGASSVRPHAANQAGANTYTYDANGNMTSAIDSVSSVAWRTLSYDVDNRPTSIVASGGTATLAYDYTGERVRKTVGGALTTYVGALYECSTSCTKYLFAGSTRVALKAGTSVLYFHGNHLGSTHVVTDGAGAKVEEIHYYPYGATYSDTGAVGVTRKYTGQEFDPESGLYYYGARYYDPVLGRFISADSLGARLGQPQSFNRYSYVLNNPLRYTDPTGHVECEGFWGCTKAYASAAWEGVKSWASNAWDTVTGWFGGGSGSGTGTSVGSGVGDGWSGAPRGGNTGGSSRGSTGFLGGENLWTPGSWAAYIVSDEGMASLPRVAQSVELDSVSVLPLRNPNSLNARAATRDIPPGAIVNLIVERGNPVDPGPGHPRQGTLAPPNFEEIGRVPGTVQPNGSVTFPGVDVSTSGDFRYFRLTVDFQPGPSRLFTPFTPGNPRGCAPCRESPPGSAGYDQTLPPHRRPWGGE